MDREDWNDIANGRDPVKVENITTPVRLYFRVKGGMLHPANVKHGRLHYSGPIFASIEEAQKFVNENYPDKQFVCLPFYDA